MINILPPEVFNLLSAGEVVENPAAVVKECIENSVDAGATKIEIEIWRGGLDKIRVSDNGSGIDNSEVEKVFLPHATSKIKCAKDIEKIATLGFRGEALASISAVSNVTFRTCKAGKTGTEIRLEGGKIVSKKPFARQAGTEIIIENLFYNTPARLKFLRSLNAEKNAVTMVVANSILASGRVTVKYFVDNDILFDYSGATLGDAIEGVYSDVSPDQILEIKSAQKDLKLYGYVGIPSFCKRNKSAQIVIVNGRVVSGGVVAEAVNDVFENFVTSGNFAFFVLCLNLDLTAVDVNIHPRKMTVKFGEPTLVYNFVKYAVMDAVDRYLRQKHTIAYEQKGDDELLKSISMFDLGDNLNMAKSADHIMNMYDKRENPKTHEVEQQKMDTSAAEKFKIYGTIFNTYILVGDAEKFHIIDQHAAAERVLFDRLSRQIDENRVEKQRLIEPEVIALNAEEMTKMDAAAKVLNDCGIECAPFGKSCYRITAVPVLIAKHGIDNLLDGLLGEIRITKLSDILKNKIITQCCKNAVKAGQALPEMEIRALLNDMKKQNITPTCPHGRPVIKTFTQNEIEKMFARK